MVRILCIPKSARVVNNQDQTNITPTHCLKPCLPYLAQDFLLVKIQNRLQIICGKRAEWVNVHKDWRSTDINNIYLIKDFFINVSPGSEYLSSLGRTLSSSSYTGGGGGGSMAHRYTHTQVCKECRYTFGWKYIIVNCTYIA